MITSGVAALRTAFVAKAVSAVRTFDAFNNDNDPYGRDSIQPMHSPPLWRSFFVLQLRRAETEWRSMTRDEFFRERMEARYGKGRSRCC